MKPIKYILVVLFFCFQLANIKSQEIFNAIINGEKDKAIALIKKDTTHVFGKNPRGFSAIHFAANLNQFEVLKALIENGANPLEVGPHNRQPLHWAASGGCLEIVKYLVEEHNADINAIDATNRNSLSLAVINKRTKVAEYLLEKNAIVQKEGENAFALAYFAIMQKLNKVYNEFLKSDFDFKQTYRDGSNLIFAAIDGNDIELLQRLLEKGVDVDHRNDFGETPLHKAIKTQNLNIVKKLLTLGCNVNKTDLIGKNALSIAEELQSEEIIDYLKNQGAKASDNGALKNYYPSLKEPGLTPELFAPGLICTPEHDERDMMFLRQNKELYFSRHSRQNGMNLTIFVMKNNNPGWTEPKIASFSGKVNDCESFISFDNKKMYVISQRDPQGSDKVSSWEIWVGDRIGESFDNFRLLDTTNLKGCFYPSITLDNEFLYTGPGNDLYLANIKDEKIYNIKKLGPEINTTADEYNAMISPQGDYIIFTSHGFEDHYGAGDLYISFRNEDGSWKEAINMGEEINSEFLEYCPNVSPDGKFFFFTSNKKGSEDIYWVSTQLIENLRKSQK